MHSTTVMWIVLGVVFVVGWLMLKVFWGVASFAVHFLLAAAVLAVVVHLVRGHFSRRQGAST